MWAPLLAVLALLIALGLASPHAGAVSARLQTRPRPQQAHVVAAPAEVKLGAGRQQPQPQASQSPFRAASPHGSQRPASLHEAVDASHGSQHPAGGSLTAQASASASAAVSFTNRSVLIGGVPTFIFSAEFHPFRLPVERLWRDALAKLKVEGGFNTVSIYTHWGLISPSPDVAPDLTGINDLALFLDVAKEVGMFANVRLGPYINAETNGGGMPGWVQRLPAELRTIDAAYTSAWKPYVEALGRVIAGRQLTASGADLDAASGPVIFVQLENEYYETNRTGPYVSLLRDTLRGVGVRDALFSYNEASALFPIGNFDSIVDLYGVDAYPQGFDCKNPSAWEPVSMEYAPAVRNLNLSEPLSLWEFQAGSFDPYDGAGYGKCYALTNERFARVFDRANVAQGFTVLSHYMAYGGANWGNLAEPTVYTSYDYGAPLSEDRQVRDKLREYGLLAQFLGASTLLPESTQVSSRPNTGVSSRTADVFVTHRRAASTAKGGLTPSWYILRQNDSTSTSTASFALTVEAGASGRTRTIPTKGAITLDGRDSRIVSTNHALPSGGGTLLYSTAAMSFAGRIHDGLDVVVLYGDVGQDFEAAFAGAGGAKLRPSVVDSKGDTAPSVTVTHERDEVRLNWRLTASSSAAHVLLSHSDGKQTLLLLADTAYAYLTRPLSLAAKGTRRSYTPDPGADVVLVHGGYHFATAELSGGTLHLRGQANASHADLEVLGPRGITEITFNGAPLPDVRATEYGAVRASLPRPSSEATAWRPPALKGWKVADSLPEVRDSGSAADAGRTGGWVKADKKHTNNPYFYLPEVRTGGTVLFADEYGFHGGHVLWQGRFATPGDRKGARSDGTGTGKPAPTPTGLRLRVQGGSFFGASAWLNGVHIGSAVGSTNRSDGHITARGLAAYLREPGAQNTLTILQDSTGLEEAVGSKALGAGNTNETEEETPYKRGAKFPLEGPKLPRGILAYEFLHEGKGAGNASLKIDDWQVRGNLGGERCPDGVRKCLNEGGLWAEVRGWHLPGYTPSSSDGFTDVPSGPSLPLGAEPGVRFFSTEVDLDVPRGYDLPLAVSFPQPSGKVSYRATLYVNGWQFGQYLPQFGPQEDFPVPPGVLDPRGRNKIALVVWTLGRTAGEDEDGQAQGEEEIPAPRLRIATSDQDGGGPYAGDPLETATGDAPEFSFELPQAGWKALRGGGAS